MVMLLCVQVSLWILAYQVILFLARLMKESDDCPYMPLTNILKILQGRHFIFSLYVTTEK